MALAVLLATVPSAASPRAEIDLLRAGPGAERLYVQATLPDGSTGVFLVDTGADISVLTDEHALRLSLDAGRETPLWGLGGTQQARVTTLPSLALGDVVVRDVLVAVGVKGVSDAGFVPVAGILGNNVWSRFTLEIDYPADLLVLHPPGAGPERGRGAPMFFDGAHVSTLVEVTTKGERRTTRGIVAEVDTGASELTLCAGVGLPLAGDHTEGLEMLLGIGASETLPPYRFLQMTRRVPVDAVSIGGVEVDVEIPARWVGYDRAGSMACDDALIGGMKALIGHEYLARHRVVFDYALGRLALLPSRRPPRQLDGHAVLHAQEVAAHGEAPERGLYRGKLLLGLGRNDDALRAFRAFVAAPDVAPDERAEARVWAARVLRDQGRHEEAWKALDGITPGELVDQDLVVGTVNGLVFEGRIDEALALAGAALAERPDAGWAHVAHADVLHHLGDHERAQAELLEAARLDEYPDAHLLRRARVALAAGDRYGSMAHVRRQIELYPHDGKTLWFYALLAQDAAERETFRADLEAAMARLHPFQRPFDFLVAAHRVLGDDATSWLAEGTKAHCDPLPEGTDEDNCLAWYWALAGLEPEQALTRIDRALAATGPRSDYLDTKAMVHLSRGEVALARTAAHEAARLAPDDVYMLWQAERIAQLEDPAPPAVAPEPVSEYEGPPKK